MVDVKKQVIKVAEGPDGYDDEHAGEVAEAVHSALVEGSYVLARELAAEGAELHPEHEELQKMARALAPPKLVEVLPANPSMSKNHVWIRHHADEYTGKWIALRDGKLLASGDTISEVKSGLKAVDDVLLTRIH